MKKRNLVILLLVCLMIFIIGASTKSIWSITATNGVTLYLQPKLRADVRVIPKVIIDSTKLSDSLFIKYNPNSLPILYVVDSSVTYSLCFVSSQKDTILFPIYTKTSTSILPDKKSK